MPSLSAMHCNILAKCRIPHSGGTELHIECSGKKMAGIGVVQFRAAEKEQILTRRCDVPGRDQTQFLFSGH